MNEVAEPSAPAPGEVIQARWDHTIRSLDRLGLLKKTNEVFNEDDVVEFQGRPIIRRDSPINGGVYLGGRQREAIVVDDEKHPDELLESYRAFDQRLSRLEFFKKLQFFKKGGRDINSDDIVNQAYYTVLEYVPVNEEHVKKLLRDHSADRKISLGSYIRTKEDKKNKNNIGGVCRHQALEGAYLIEKRIREGKLKGKVSVDRSEIPGIGGHAWARFTDEFGEVYIIDSTWGYKGKLSEVPESDIKWIYARPEDKAS